MNKQQIHKRVSPEAIARVLRDWNDGRITTQMAMAALEISRPQLYRLRTSWLSRGKRKSIRLGVSGGDHSGAWPAECVEHLTKMLESSGEHGPDYVIFRPHNVYGEHQNIGDPYRNVIGIFMRQILTGKPLTIFGDGEQVRAFSYIDDVAPVIAACIERPDTWNQVYNIGADKPWSVNKLATTVCKAMGAEASSIQHLDARNEVVTAYSSHEKVKRVFGDLILNVPLSEGIAKMAAWVKTLKTIPEPKRFGHIEVLKNLPPSWAKLA